MLQYMVIELNLLEKPYPWTRMLWFSTPSTFKAPHVVSGEIVRTSAMHPRHKICTLVHSSMTTQMLYHLQRRWSSGVTVAARRVSVMF